MSPPFFIRTVMLFSMWLLKPWTRWTIHSGIPSCSFWIQTASKEWKPWGTASCLGQVEALANSMNSQWSSGRPAPTFSQVLSSNFHCSSTNYLKLIFGVSLIRIFLTIIRLHWSLGVKILTGIVFFLILTFVFSFLLSNYWTELSQWCVVWQCERVHSGAAGQSCLGVWGQGEPYSVMCHLCKSPSVTAWYSEM